MNGYGPILFGWALGLLPPVVWHWLSQRKQKNDMKKGVSIELKEIKFRLLLGYYRILSRVDQISREDIKWLIDNFANYPNEVKINTICNELNALYKLKDDQIRESLKADNRKTLLLKKFELPYLTSKLGAIDIFDEQLQSKIYQIKDWIFLINEETNNYLMFYSKSFDVSSDIDRLALKANLDILLTGIFHMSRQTVEKINTLLADLEHS